MSAGDEILFGSYPDLRRIEARDEAYRTGEYVDQFSTPYDLLTPEGRVEAALASLQRLPRCLMGVKNEEKDSQTKK